MPCNWPRPLKRFFCFGETTDECCENSLLQINVAISSFWHGMKKIRKKKKVMTLKKNCIFLIKTISFQDFKKQCVQCISTRYSSDRKYWHLADFEPVFLTVLFQFLEIQTQMKSHWKALICGFFTTLSFFFKLGGHGLLFQD